MGYLTKMGLIQDFQRLVMDWETHEEWMEALLRNYNEDVKTLMMRFRGLPQYDNCEILKWENGIVKGKDDYE